MGERSTLHGSLAKIFRELDRLRLFCDVRCWTGKFGRITNQSLRTFVSDRHVYFLNQPCGNGGCPQIPNPSRNLGHMPNRGKK